MISVCDGKAPAAETLAAVARAMERLKLPVNAEKTRCLRCPEEPSEFLGYRNGRNFRTKGRGAYIGTRPSAAERISAYAAVSRGTDGQKAWAHGGREHGETPEPDAVRLGELLRTSARSARPTGPSTSIRQGGCGGGSVSSTKSEAGVRALPEREAVD